MTTAFDDPYLLLHGTVANCQLVAAHRAQDDRLFFQGSNKAFLGRCWSLVWFLV